MSASVSRDDLCFAVDWIETYDGQPDDANNAAAARVSAWLRREIRHRDEEAAIREIRKQVPGATAAQARAALRAQTGTAEQSG